MYAQYRILHNMQETVPVEYRYYNAFPPQSCTKDAFMYLCGRRGIYYNRYY